MKTMLIGTLCVCALLSGGCTENKITVGNGASGTIWFNFRAREYEVPAGNSVEITDIPNGTYAYTTVASIPAGASSWEMGEGTSGNLTLQQKNTEIYLQYISNYKDSVYTVEATYTTTDPVSMILAP